MRLILAGGGSAVDARPLDELLARWLGRGAKLLYLPFALPGGHPLLAGSERWIRSVFMPLGIGDIETWHAAELAARTADEWADGLVGFDGVYIGGGNTFRLLHLLRVSGLDRALVAYANGGRPISGGSAGAIILGADIAIAEWADTNDVDLRDTSGLGLLPDCDVLPHYESMLNETIQAHVRRTGRGVIALSERAGIAIDGEQRYDAGYERSLVFMPPAPTANGSIGSDAAP